jgi:DNA repair exonuclease SbcCD ATPase subunit
VAYKLENVAKQLEEGINYYLSTLSDGQFQIIFRLSGDKLNIVVINNGEEVSIDSLSGGEFSRVQTAVLLAVRSTLSKIGGKTYW